MQAGVGGYAVYAGRSRWLQLFAGRVGAGQTAKALCAPTVGLAQLQHILRCTRHARSCCA